jgi:Putative prokaryotic signal transducing protein
MSEPRLVTVYVSQGMLSAQVVLGKLETVGIPAILKYEAIGQIMGLTVDGLGRVEVQVPEEFASDALDLLQEETDSESDETVSRNG